MPSQNEMIAWAAGVFEGEGSISFRGSNNGKCYSQLEIVSTDKDVVVKFYDIIGCGTVYGPYWSGTKATKPCYRWICTKGGENQRVFKLFEPFLCKRRKARFKEVFATNEKAWQERHQ